MMDERRQALTKVLVKVAANIEKLQQRRSHIGEQDTKTILINPILGALGWDLQSIDDVSQEYRHKPKDNPVDYALFFLRQPCLFVEAKALGSNLDDRKWISQTISYATIAGVEWCILTNGAEYRLYNAHAPVAVDEKLFRIVRVADAPSDPHTIETLELLSKDKIGENLLNVFWKAHFVDRRVKAVFEDIIRNQDKGLVRLLKKKTDGLTSPQIAQSLKRAEVAIDFPTISASPAVVPEKSAKKEETEESTRGKGPHKIPHWLSLSRLIDAGLIKPPLNLEADYKSQHLTAIVQPDGNVIFDGKTYTALSAAGGMARNAVIGPPPDGRPYWPTNGWSFWKFQDHETGELEEISLLRKRFLEKQG